MRLNTLQTLMVQSRELESDLRDLPEKPRVMRASTVATIAISRIALPRSTTS